MPHTWNWQGLRAVEDISQAEVIQVGLVSAEPVPYSELGYVSAGCLKTSGAEFVDLLVVA